MEVTTQEGCFISALLLFFLNNIKVIGGDDGDGDVEGKESS